MQRNPLEEKNLSRSLDNLEYLDVNHLKTREERELHISIVRLIPFARIYLNINKLSIESRNFRETKKEFDSKDADIADGITELRSGDGFETYISVISERRKQLEKIALICAEWQYRFTQAGRNVDIIELGKKLSKLVEESIKECDTLPYVADKLLCKEKNAVLKVQLDDVKKRLIACQKKLTTSTIAQQDDSDNDENAADILSNSNEWKAASSQRPKSNFKWKGLFIGGGITMALTLAAVIITVIICPPASLAPLLFKVLMSGLCAIGVGATTGAIVDNCCSNSGNVKPSSGRDNNTQQTVIATPAKKPLNNSSTLVATLRDGSMQNGRSNAKTTSAEQKSQSNGVKDKDKQKSRSKANGNGNGHTTTNGNGAALRDSSKARQDKIGRIVQSSAGLADEAGNFGDFARQIKERAKAGKL